MPEHPHDKLYVPPPPPISVSPCDLAYAELQVTTNFSFLQGASHPEELAHTAARLGYRAIGVTDHNTLAGAVRMHEAAESCGMPLVIGTRISLTDAPDLLVWPEDRAAYARLCRLLTLGKSRVAKGEFQLSLAEFLDGVQGPGVQGFGTQGFFVALTRPHDTIADLYDALKDRLSLVLSVHYTTDHSIDLEQISRYAARFSVPLLATNDVHYHDQIRRPLQDVLTCIRSGCTIHAGGHNLFPNGERYLKSPAQMHHLFASLPQALRRGIDIARACTFKMTDLRYDYPHELVPAGLSPIQHLRNLTIAGALSRFDSHIPDSVRLLIEHEFKLIEQLHFEYYFLTVHDIVVFARSRDILCQGRGSAANSAVCYCLGITNVDPTQIDLLFERFISAARNEPPDIDVDFEHERREEVLQYIYAKYGRQRSAMCAEVISYRGRSAVREVGKALGLSLDQVDQMARRLDWWHRGVLTSEQVQQAGLDPHDPTVKKVLDLAQQILGFPRHLGQHVGGMVMTHTALCELVPIANAAMENRTVIEWDKDDIDTIGMIKVDCLGLGMLSVISRANHLINPSITGRDTAPQKASPLALSPTDASVYDMICDADTIGVFQIESRAQMSMLPRLKPRCFYDLVIEVAIVRPGPIQGDMVHPYLRRRCGEESVSFPSEALARVLGKTLGVPLFQEQAMKVAMVGANFSAEEADQLRRAMAQWRKNDKIQVFKQRIIEGMLGNGYTQEFADQCFRQIKGFCEYGFPESHAASFAHLVYVSAWLKRYHPAAFCAALINSQPMGFYAPAQLVRDAIDHGVQVRAADINHSDWDCTLETPTPDAPLSPRLRADFGSRGPAVRMGLCMLKGMKQTVIEAMIDSRNRQGNFASIDDLQQRTRIGRTTIRQLAEADAFGSLGLSRRKALWNALALEDEARPLAESATLFDDSATLLPAMPHGQEVLTDYATIGLSLKDHPIALVRSELKKARVMTCAALNQMSHGSRVRVAGLVLIRQRPGTASGIVFITLEDETGIANLIVRPNIFEQYNDAARFAAVLECEGTLERKDKVIHVMAWKLTDLGHLTSSLAFQSRDFH